MKRFIMLVMSLILIILFCGCTNTKNEIKAKFDQKMTIILNESQMSKTTDSVAVIENMIDILGGINKSGTIDDWIGACEYKIIITVDGNELTYMFGGKTFCDADGKLYKVTNAEETKEQIKRIFDNIDS